MKLRLGLVGIVLCLAALGFVSRPAPIWRFAEPLLPDPTLPAKFETIFEYTSPEGTAHAPAILPGSGDAFSVIWFDGIRESHNDVRILGVTFPDPDNVTEVLTRQSASANLHPRQTVLTLGNTIGDGSARLLATTVSLGGWAASSVSHLAGAKSAASQSRRLNLSPLLARSHLVKSPVVAMENDAHLLPSYFEMGQAFGVTAYLDEVGRVRGMSDMRGPNKAIQPMVVATSSTDAVALLRNFDPEQGPLMASWTQDGGQNWTAPTALDLPNPSAPVAAVRLSTGAILMAFNDALDRADTLTLALSVDAGRTWARGHVFGTEGGGDLRYPMMQVLESGRIALTYSTEGKSGIIVHVFTENWVMTP
ncbi:MAG: exo-alpha-sialidase [Aliishimia sp.]